MFGHKYLGSSALDLNIQMNIYLHIHVINSKKNNVGQFQKQGINWIFQAAMSRKEFIVVRTSSIMKNMKNNSISYNYVNKIVILTKYSCVYWPAFSPGL
jgi:hypothetical protein